MIDLFSAIFFALDTLFNTSFLFSVLGIFALFGVIYIILIFMNRR